MWIGTQADVNRLPVAGELQLTDVYAVYHLMVDGASCFICLLLF